MRETKGSQFSATEETFQVARDANRRTDFAKIDSFFDSLEHCVERMESLVWKSKRLIFGTAFMLFLMYELAHFAKFLMHNW
jgi:hypothetical protein